jgi:hypothetical protein
VNTRRVLPDDRYDVIDLHLHSGKLIRIFLLVLLVGCLLPARSAAQQPDVDASPAAPLVTDTLLPSPRGAFIRSLVVPGWGQTYVGAPGRGALYFSAEVGSLWMVYKARQQLRSARQLETNLRDTGQLTGPQRLDLVISREAQQEDWITLALFVMLFSGADAYVAAQLADFDDRFGVRPVLGGGVELEARFPLGFRR